MFGHYAVDERAVAFWEQVPHGTAIVVVVGKYHTGKSLLMNKCPRPTSISDLNSARVIEVIVRRFVCINFSFHTHEFKK